MSLLQRVEAARTAQRRAKGPGAPPGPGGPGWDERAPGTGARPGSPSPSRAASGRPSGPRLAARGGLPRDPPPTGGGRRRRPRAAAATSPTRSGSARSWPTSSRSSWTASSRSRASTSRAVERQRLVDGVLHEVAGFGPIEPLLADPTVTEVMVNGPKRVYIERAGRIEKVDITLPRRRARPQRHRPHHHAARAPHRRDEPARGRPPAGRLARQRHHPAAVARRPRHHRAQVRHALQRRGPRPLRHGHRARCSTSCGPAWRRASTSSSRAAPAPARPPR